MRQLVAPFRCFVAIGLAMFGTTTVVLAQPAAKVHRLGLLSQTNIASASDQRADDLRQGLRDLGYAEGRNFVIEFRQATDNPERLKELAEDLARIPVDVIVTSGEKAARAAKLATRTIPIIAMEIGPDPVNSGLVMSLARPEGNLTGLATQSEELWSKRLGLLRDIAPKASRLAVLWNPANSGAGSCVDEMSRAARQFEMRARYLEVRDASTVKLALADIAKEPFDGVALCWDRMTLEHAAAIAEHALKLKLPTLAPFREYVDAGALLSLGSSLPAQRRRAAYYIDRILKGAKPSDLPIERPTVFKLVVNLKTAKALGLALSPQLAVQIDDVVPLTDK